MSTRLWRGNSLRFSAHGPSIPDELLLARDHGRVIFFCGAGVSRARAHLPDFFGLAERVIAKLGVQQDSPAYKLVSQAQEIEARVGTGVISADRIFGLLEREFDSKDIEEAVASALAPAAGCDLSAHEILLDLATTGDGLVQLVTTNFDRLFNECGRELPFCRPPRLPDPLRPGELSGITYLHGRAKPDYSGAEGDGFVLSSSEFGRAYLSDGWATTFFRKILERYVVVFVGYAADDPPVQYLLEALHKSSRLLGSAYAFQSGDRDDAAARWRHKGVEAIPYSPINAHAALWETLEAWAELARDPEAWSARVIGESRRGPETMPPHQRGQVAHIVSTYEGAKKFSHGDDVPPAEWLCVFDKYRRFAKPGKTWSHGQKGPSIDPFDLYGLDSDTQPAKAVPGDHSPKRETPPDAWDAFELNGKDRSPVRDENFAALRGPFASRAPRLVPRVAQLGVWLAKVCDQPAAIWWAVRQTSLHENIRSLISRELSPRNARISKESRQVWLTIFETWDHIDDFDEWYQFKDFIEHDGWDTAAVRRFGTLLCPRLTTGVDFLSGPTPPGLGEGGVAGTRSLLRDVKYPDLHDPIAVPLEWRPAVVRVLRQNLELAVTLEQEIGGYGLRVIAPIARDETQTDDYHRSEGLSGALFRFVDAFSALAKSNKRAAKREIQAWPVEDDTLFARLRIWIARDQNLVSGNEFVDIVESLSITAFWDSYHQRDFLLALSERWPKLNKSSRETIEKSLLKGPKRWPREKSAAFESRRAWIILSRMHWLQIHGCKLSPASKAQAEALRVFVPEWKDEYGANAANSLESRSGWVKTDKSHDQLVDVPLSSLLVRAQELSGRSKKLFVEQDPFAGLAAERPARALTALRHAAERGDYPPWAWRSFLALEARKGDDRRLAWSIAHRLSRSPDKQVAAIMHSVTSWFEDAGRDRGPECVPTFDMLFRKLLGVLREVPSAGCSGVIRGSHTPDWTMEAINAPTGKMAEALFQDPRANNLQKDGGLTAEWLAQAEALLELTGDMRRYALVIFCRNLSWFFAMDQAWTEKHLLPALRASPTEDRDAAWAGFLWGARTPQPELYARLKSDMIEFAAGSTPSRRAHGEIIAGIILAGWGRIDAATGERYISDEEIRSLLLQADDDFRSRVLWQAQRWAKEKDGDTGERWRVQLPELLRVWPRQLAARSPNTSARLCELAFSSGDQFPHVVPLVLPLLSKIEREHISLPILHRSDNIVDRYPEQALALLHAVLPDNASAWPYGIEGTLMRIGEADNALDRDERLIALKRAWDMR